MRTANTPLSGGRWRSGFRRWRHFFLHMGYVRHGLLFVRAELDLVGMRQVSHAQRHGLIFSAYRDLAPGAGFVLVNDHDPKPLRYQFGAQYADEYTWDYLEAGPEVWRVRIGRARA